MHCWTSVLVLQYLPTLVLIYWLWECLVQFRFTLSNLSGQQMVSQADVWVVNKWTGNFTRWCSKYRTQHWYSGQEMWLNPNKGSLHDIVKPNKQYLSINVLSFSEGWKTDVTGVTSFITPQMFKAEYFNVLDYFCFGYRLHRDACTSMNLWRYALWVFVINHLP